jgi:hypothetical protein
MARRPCSSGEPGRLLAGAAPREPRRNDEKKPCPCSIFLLFMIEYDIHEPKIFFNDEKGLAFMRSKTCFI